MKKQKLRITSLQLRKINIASLHHHVGGHKILSEESACCSKPPLCPQTLTTRPDSLKD